MQTGSQGFPPAQTRPMLVLFVIYLYWSRSREPVELILSSFMMLRVWRCSETNVELSSTSIPRVQLVAASKTFTMQLTENNSLCVKDFLSCAGKMNYMGNIQNWLQSAHQPAYEHEAKLAFRCCRLCGCSTNAPSCSVWLCNVCRSPSERVKDE